MNDFFDLFPDLPWPRYPRRAITEQVRQIRRGTDEARERFNRAVVERQVRAASVRSFADAGREWRISTAGGVAPKWRGDGREIYYLDRDSRLMAVSLTLSRIGSGVVQHDPPRALFALAPGSTFEPAADSQRFLVNAVVATPPIAVILNWRPPAGTK
jgi:hypothetical protein